MAHKGKSPTRKGLVNSGKGPRVRLREPWGEQRVRRQTVEHPFGTLKAWMGATHFLTKTLDQVSTEMSLHVLAYNFKRVLNLLGNSALMAAMKA